jgi:thiol-disulfide isomerase/thioredoxin
MKTLKIYAVLLLIPFLLTAQDREGINFEHGTWVEALGKAKETNKLVYLDCYTQWCGPCKVMAANVYPQKSVGDYYNSNFINVKMDMMDGVGPELTKKYKIAFYPTHLFVDANGVEVHRKVGGMNVEAFITLGKDVFGDKTLSGMNKKYDSGLREPQFLVEYFNILATSRSQDKLKNYLNDYFKSTPDNELSKEINWNFINTYVDKLTSREFQYLYNNRTEFEKLYPKEDIDKKIKTTIQWGGYKYIVEKNGVNTIDRAGFEEYKKWMIDHKIENLEATFLSCESVFALKTKKYLEYTRIMDKAMAEKLMPSSAQHIYQYVARCIICKEEAVLKKADQWLDIAMDSLEEGDRWIANIEKLKKIVARDLKEIEDKK